MADPDKPFRDLLNRSGIPFQLAIEEATRRVGARHGVEIVRREIPWSNGFVDIVARREQILFAFECKRVDDKSWLFVSSNQGTDNVTRCRLEWRKGMIPRPTNPLTGRDRVFCSEWDMCEGSPESDFCVIPKGSPVKSLESVCRELISACHDLLADEDITYGDNVTPIVPLVVTTAKLLTCRFDPGGLPTDTGKLDAGLGQFTPVDLMRFRKPLVTDGSNPYQSSGMALKDWAADRDRTVFVLSASALERFLAGFRAFFPRK